MKPKMTPGGARILNGATETVSAASVQPHPRNVNVGDVGAIYGSIEHNGFFGTLVVQRSTGHILVGAHRWLAAKQAGYAELPVTWVDVDDATALRIMLADNRTARLGHDDPPSLAALLQEIMVDAGTLDGTGFDAGALDELLTDMGLAAGDAGDDPGEPPAEDEAVSQAGVVYELGPHRLLCGDSTSPEHVRILLGEVQPEVMLMDPPFDVEYDAWAIPDFVRLMMVWVRGHTGLRWVAQRVGDKPLWGVSTLAFSGQARGWARPEYPCLIHEVVYVLRRGENRGARCRPGPAKAYGLRVTEDDRPFSFYEGLASRRNDMSWAKNPACYAVFLCMASDGEVVYDPCAGSGASLLASDRSGNPWYGIEMQPRWCDLIRRRYAEAAGRPELLP